MRQSDTFGRTPSTTANEANTKLLATASRQLPPTKCVCRLPGVYNRNLSIGILGLTVLLCAACDPAKPGAVPLRKGLPAYEGNIVNIFDDSVASSAAGFPGASSDAPGHDSAFGSRAQLSDYIVSARLVTTESPPAGGHLITFRTLEKLAGKYNPPQTFQVQLAPENAYNKLLDVPNSPLLAKPLIVFVKEFAVDGVLVRHVHLEPDTSEVRMAVAAQLART